MIFYRANEANEKNPRRICYRQMKQFLFIALILFSTNFTFGQKTQTAAPLSQTEYVKMLYDAQKNPAVKQDLIDALRKRGIGFELNAGLRSLTMSKSRNDAELKRTLEEADRRRQNPTAAKLPSDIEAKEIIEKTRKNTLEAIEEMPDFVVKQLINRQMAYAGTNNWKPLDRLLIAVSYSAQKGEQYKVLAVNGSQVESKPGSNYGGLDGATTGGEFVEDLEKIFKSESKTEFKVIDTDFLRNNQSVVFEYNITLENNKSGIGYKGASYISSPAGQNGKIWIDRKNFRVLRIEANYTDIEANFPVKAFQSNTDYDWVKISDQSYLLPIQSNAVFTSKESIGMIQSQNVIRFKDYQKFGTDVIVLDDDTEEAPAVEEPKPQP